MLEQKHCIPALLSSEFRGNQWGTTITQQAGWMSNPRCEVTKRNSQDDLDTVPSQPCPSGQQLKIPFLDATEYACLTFRVIALAQPFSRLGEAVYLNKSVFLGLHIGKTTKIIFFLGSGVCTAVGSWFYRML